MAGTETIFRNLIYDISRSLTKKERKFVCACFMPFWSLNFALTAMRNAENFFDAIMNHSPVRANDISHLSYVFCIGYSFKQQKQCETYGRVFGAKYTRFLSENPLFWDLMTWVAELEEEEKLESVVNLLHLKNIEDPTDFAMAVLPLMPVFSYENNDHLTWMETMEEIHYEMAARNNNNQRK